MKDMKNVLIISLTVLLAAAGLSFVYFNRAKADDVVTVSGLGKVDFQADLIVWKGSFLQKADTLEQAYALLKRNLEAVKKYLAVDGIKDNEVTFSSAEITKLYSTRYTSDGKSLGDQFDGYQLKQGLRVESKDVDRVEKLSRSITELIDQGIEFTSESPDYFFTGLSDLKLKLIATATKDARNRAQQIAANAGGNLGKLRFASMGVFQIIETNSADETSWEGTFNTKARNKTATLTVRVQYELH